MPIERVLLIQARIIPGRDLSTKKDLTAYGRRVGCSYVERPSKRITPWTPPYHFRWRFCLCLDSKKKPDTKKPSTSEGFFSSLLIFEIFRLESQTRVRNGGETT